MDTDYLVVGAGAAGMAFADTLLTDTDAHITIVDRRDRPGGHWNDAYPFVRLHQPSAFYGVNSRELSQGTKDAVGLNHGLYDLAGGADVVSYFDQVMQQRFLPSGRVRYFPMSNMVGDNEFESLPSGQRHRVNIRKKRVDATYSDTAVPSTHPPKYGVAPGVRCVPLNDLPKIKKPQAGYVVVGSGKTGIDACLWLLAHGVAPASIRWIMPRDAWLLDRANLQPGDEFFFTSFGSVAHQFEALAAARSVPDLFMRLNAVGELLRIDERVLPTAYHCATVTQAELSELRRIEGIVRLGHVRCVETTQIVLDHGSVPIGPETLVVDCSANAIPQRPAVPVWTEGRITLQTVRRCQPTFSAAFIAHVEATFHDDAEKNSLCTPVPLPDLDIDWLRMLAIDMANRRKWSQHEHLMAWLARSRLDCFFHSLRSVRPDDTERMALVRRVQQAMQPAIENLQRLLTTLARPEGRSHARIQAADA